MVASLSLNAQGIYTAVEELDKFDDEVSKRTVKTRIVLTEDTITIETKGSTPVEYLCLADPIKTGSKQSPKELIDGIWGYEVTYVCVLKKDFGALIKEAVNREDGADMALLKKYNAVLITFRTITTQYSHEFLDKLAWVKYFDGSRIVYM